jgi:chromosome segregation ATPase
LTFKNSERSVKTGVGGGNEPGDGGVIMQNAFEEIREQIHEIRNLLSPIDLKLDNLDHKITISRIAFESKTAELDAKIAANLSRLSEHDVKISEHSDEIAQQSERLKRIEQFLKLPQNTEKSAAAPVREDKANPAIIPPQTPPA